MSGAEGVAQSNQLLQPWAIGVPGIGQGGLVSALLQLAGYVLKAFGALLLALIHLVQGLLTLGTGLLSLPGQRLLVTEGLGQAVQVGMGQVRLLYQWRGFTLPGLGLGGRQLGGLQGLLQPGLLFAEHALLAKMGTDLFGQRA